MARPVLINGQREALLQWLAADYDWALIKKWFAERNWPEITNEAVCYYRKRYEPDIEEKRKARRESAINSGLALKEERIARLAKHADELEAIKWLPDEKGRLWNEKAWRETLDDIAKEMGHRKTTIDIKVVIEEAKRLAERMGLDVSAVLAEAERIVASGG